MEDRYQHTIAGQEVTEDDINSVSLNASLADDHVFAELFRLGSGARGVTASTPTSAIVVPSGSADARVSINPFRAFLGALSPSNAQDAYKNGRSAVMGNAASTAITQIQHPAIVTNPRWDLIYAQVNVDIDSATENRYVKTGPAPAVSTPIVPKKKTTVTIVLLQGAEGASPAKPAIPSDSGSAYNIALAYVLLPAGHTLTTAIDPKKIHDVAPVMHVSRATGAATLMVANQMFKEGGTVLTNETWTTANGRPKAYLPPTMSGKRELIFALTETATRPSIPLGNTAIIDDSIDWRYRVIMVNADTSARVASTNRTGAFPWNVTSGSANSMMQGQQGSTSTFEGVFFMRQSWNADPTTTKAMLASLFPGNTKSGDMQASSSLNLWVDMTTGALKADVSATNPDCNFFFWIQASGQFNNF